MAVSFRCACPGCPREAVTGRAFCDQCGSVVSAEECASTHKPPPIEVRVIPDGDSWTVEGWRGGEQRYTRLFNRTADEAWHYGAEWMRGEMMKNAKETK